MGLMGGYQSMNEHSYLLLVDLSKDQQKRQDEMQIDGGNLDDDKIEREWWQLTILTSLQVQEDDTKQIFEKAITNVFNERLEELQDVKAHFLKKESATAEQVVSTRIKKVMELSEVVFKRAVLPSGKTDDVTSEQVQQLKKDLGEMVNDIPAPCMGQMVRSWHYFRLEESGYWYSLGDKYIVDSSLQSDAIHPQTNVQGGRITKNVDKMQIYIANVSLFLDGAELSANKFEVELVLSYSMELTLKTSKALLIDSKSDPKRIIRNLEETLFYKLPELQKVILSGSHHQDIVYNNNKIIVRNFVIDQDEWVDPKHFVRSKIMDVPLQSLFFSLINYRNIMEKYFYLPGSKEQVDKADPFCTIQILNFEFVHLQSIKGNYDTPDPATNLSMFQ